MSDISTLTSHIHDVAMIDKLPKARFWGDMELRQWEGFWFERSALEKAMTFRSSFHARDDDVFITSAMKTGTGWLKAISFSIIKNDVEKDSLATETPYFLVPSVVTSFSATKPLPFDIYDASSPRLLHTHVPYSLLPDSIKNSACKIIYITRNPKDTVISMWHFMSSIKGPFPLEEVVNSLCCGVYPYGSFFDHVVEYWMESKEKPEKILFLKYEELKSDPERQISKIVEFLGKPFLDEVQVEEIIKRCSLERLKNLDVNKNGSFKSNVPNSAFFRKGEVSDWKNYLTPEMVERINQITHIKLETLGIFL